jgi:miniconductance mechanosensitive channel
LDNAEIIHLIEQNLLLALLAVILLAIITFIVTRWVVATVLVYIAKRTSTQYDDIIVENLRPFRVAVIAPLLVIYSFAYLLPSYQNFLQKLMLFLILWVIVFTFNSLMNALNQIYETGRGNSGVSIQGYLDIAKILAILVAIILSISIFTNQSPIVLLSGLGAITAILLLIFRDTILSLVASIQISAYDLIKEGDWLEVPSYGADGDVIDISLHTIKIQNFDKTITIIPTYKMVEVGYKNWRGMQESGGRRIKRSISLDLTSLQFCDLDTLKKYQQVDLIHSFLDEKISEIENFRGQEEQQINSPLDGPQLTNATVYRVYIEAYLKSRQDIYAEGMTFLIRELAPGPTGLPIELYIFTRTIDWVKYELIQAEIIDHLIAAADYFDVRIFQEPTGRDLARLASAG